MRTSSLFFISAALSLFFAQCLLAAATVLVNCRVPGAVIQLDGRQAGVSDTNGLAFIAGVPPGSHALDVIKAGYETHKETITVKDRLTTFYDVILAVADRTPPEIRLLKPEPERGLIIAANDEPLSIIGLARDNRAVVSVSVNGQPAALAIASEEEKRNFPGNTIKFKALLQVHAGKNPLLIETLDAAGNRGTLENTVIKEKTVFIKDSLDNIVPLYRESHALLIGASDYKAGWPVLPGVFKDIEALRPVLKNQGFDVVEVRDPDSEQLKAVINNFITSYGLDPENRLLIYFAGHGHSLEQSYGDSMGYIVPVDAPNPNRDHRGFLEKALDMRMIEVYAMQIQSKHALFMFDCCFSGAVFDITRAIPENITYKIARPVRQFITSGSAGERVSDKSIFREQFVAALSGEGDIDKDGYVTGAELGEFLQKNVINYSKGAQHPQYGKIRNSKLDKGDFVFQLVQPGTH